MYHLQILENGLTLITIPMPHLDSITSLVAVGAGSRYETKRINGISHFLEHMFFKGSRKYPTAEIIATMIDGIGAVHNASTSKEWTSYWIKSSSKHLELCLDVLSSMVKESLLSPEEIEKEKGVVIEELRMFRDNPQRYVWDLYEMLQFGDQPLGWDIGGNEQNIRDLKEKDLVDYINSLYSPKNMVVVLAGKMPKDAKELVEKYTLDFPHRASHKFESYRSVKQHKPKVSAYYKDTDQANLILGVESYDRHDPKRFATELLSVILGGGSSSRLFIQVRERRGLAYHISSSQDSYVDTGTFTTYAGLKLENVSEGLEVIVAELQRIASEKVVDDELKKAKEVIRGRLALRTESTNFLAEHFGVEFILDRELESFDEYLRHIDKVTVQDLQDVAQDLFKKERFNLQLIGPFKSTSPFEKILS